VRQVGYLQTLYRDARSTEHETLWRRHVKCPTSYFSDCLRLTNRQCTYGTYHVTLHSSKRFGARRRHISGSPLFNCSIFRPNNTL